MKSAAILGALLCGASPWTASQDGAPESRAMRVESICHAAVATSSLHGVAVVVSLGGDTLLSASYAAPDLDQRQAERVGAERASGAAFEPLVASAVARLVAQGKLLLDDRVASRLPQFEASARAVSVSQLLTHTSGIASYGDYVRVHGDVSRDELLGWLAKQPLAAEPGTCFEYTESNVLLAAAIVESTAGMPLERALAELVLEPARVGGFGWTPADSAPRADVELLDAFGESIRVEAPWRWIGPGRPQATLADLAQLAHGTWIRRGSDTERLAALDTLQRLPDGSELPLAWGWTRSRSGRRTVLSFGGRSGDCVVHVAAVPDVELVVALASQNSGESLDALARQLVRAVLEEPDPRVVDLELPEEVRLACTGAYYIGCTRIAIEERGDELWFAPPADDAVRLRFQGGHAFVSTVDADVRITFEVRNGRATGFVLDTHGSQVYARRVE